MIVGEVNIRAVYIGFLDRPNRGFNILIRMLIALSKKITQIFIYARERKDFTPLERNIRFALILFSNLLSKQLRIENFIKIKISIREKKKKVLRFSGRMSFIINDVV